jgi:ribokinase
MNNRIENAFPHLRPAESHRTDLMVVGDTGIDLMVRVDDLPKTDGKAIGESLGIFAGGMGANFACAARKSSADLGIALISKVGADAFGEACLQALREQDIDTHLVVVEPGQLTWWCAVAIDSEGEKALLGGRTDASLPDTQQTSEAQFENVRWVHSLGDVPSSLDVIKAAQAAGAIASVDIEGSFVAGQRIQAEKLVGLADLVIVNTDSLRMLTDEENYELALRQLLHDRPNTAILLTRGSAGSAFAFTNSRSAFHLVEQIAAPVATVVDTTGAGDSFAGTFVASVLRHGDVADAMAAASEMAAQTIGHLGARPGGLPGWIRPI